MGYHTLVASQYQNATESHLIIEGKHVLKDRLVEWIPNNFISTRPLDVHVVQVPRTVALMPPQLVTRNMGNRTRTVWSKPNLTLTYWESREKYRTHDDGMCKNRTGNEHDNRTKRYYLRLREDKGPIKITGEVFHIEPLKLINVKHALENLRNIGKMGLIN